MNSILRAEVLPSTPCDQALAIWFEQHKAYIPGGTVRTYRQYMRSHAITKLLSDPNVSDQM